MAMTTCLFCKTLSICLGITSVADFVFFTSSIFEELQWTKIFGKDFALAKGIRLKVQNCFC